MSITRLTKHNNHQVSIHRCKPKAVHFAALRCSDCNTHIQWLSKEDFFAVRNDCLVIPSISSSLGKEAKTHTKNEQGAFL